MQIKDSGTRDTFETGAQRDAETGKGRFDLLPFDAIQRVAQVFENGAKKYDERNWEKGIPLHRFLDSGLRHAMKYQSGYRDEEHLAMACWNLLCALQTETWIQQGRRPESLNTLPHTVLPELSPSFPNVANDPLASPILLAIPDAYTD